MSTYKVHHIAHYEVGYNRRTSHWETKEFPTRWEATKFAEEWRATHFGGAYVTSDVETTSITPVDIRCANTVARYASRWNGF